MTRRSIPAPSGSPPFRIILALSLLFSAPAAFADLQVRRLIGTGDPAPGLPGATISSVGGQLPQIDNQGNIIFGANIRGTGIGFDVATIYGRPGNFTILVQQGEPAPGLEPREVALPDYFAMGLDGQAHFMAGVYDLARTEVEYVLWKHAPGGPELLYRSNEQPPDIPEPDTTMIPFFLHAGPGGHLIFNGVMDGPGIDDSNATGLWAQTVPGGPLTLVAREGDQAAGLTDGVTYRGAVGLSPFYRLNRAGEVAFYAALEGPGVDGTNNSAIWNGTPGNLSVTARAGDPAPGAGAGVNFAGFAQLHLNDGGEHFFSSSLAGAGVTPENDLALWHGTPGNLQMVAREGDPAPGMAPGVVFEHIAALDLDESGMGLSWAAVRGPGVDETNDNGLWVGRADELELILGENDTVAGLDATAMLDLNSSISTAMSARGDVVLETDLRGPGVDEANDRGMWTRVAATGEWLKVLREGDLLDGRAVSSFGMDITIDHVGARPLNDDGILVFRVSFTDSTTAIYSVSIPEPASIGALCVGTALLARQRRLGKILNTA